MTDSTPSPAEELRTAAALLRELTYGFAAHPSYRRDVDFAAKRGIFSAPAELWARVMSPAVAKPLAGLMLEAAVDLDDNGAHPFKYEHALTLAREITKAAGQ